MTVARAELPAAAYLSRWNLPAVMMTGAALNGLVARIMEGVAIGGASGLTFGVGPFELIAILIALRLSLAGGTTDLKVPAALTVATLALILVPSSALSWLALALYSAGVAVRADGEARTGALLFLSIAVAALWSSVLVKWLALPMTSAEAWLVCKILAFVRDDIVQAANVVGNPEGHNLILMTRCTSLGALPMAIVALCSVALLFGSLNGKRAVAAALLLVLLYVAANTLRLAAMATSAELYDVIHGPIGANVFDGALVLAILFLGDWASRE